MHWKTLRTGRHISTYVRIIFNGHATFVKKKNLGYTETRFGGVHLQTIRWLGYLILYLLYSFRNKMDAFFNQVMQWFYTWLANTNSKSETHAKILQQIWSKNIFCSDFDGNFFAKNIIKIVEKINSKIFVLGNFFLVCKNI